MRQYTYSGIPVLCRVSDRLGIEVIFRRFEPSNKARKWINPGFLIGPYLPLYGLRALHLYLLAGLEKFIHTDNNGFA